MAIGDHLRQARLAKGMSQTTVAAALYVTRQTVSRWEQDQTLPNIYVLQDLSKLYGCSLETLIGKTQPTQPTKRHINWLALFGLIWFNLIVVLAVAGTAIGLLIGLWVIVITFMASPFLAVGADVLFDQTIAWWQLLAALFIGALGGSLVRPAWRITTYTWEAWKHYVRYNRRTIYTY
jgi:transcriptional regulator with XRE-family HTH domain